MGVDYKSYKLGDIFKNIEENRIVLPDFQRGYVWSIEQQRNLIATFLVDLPIGTLLHIEGKKDDFTARAICEQLTIQPKEECEYLLDGQQRISTLYNAFRDIYSQNGRNWGNIWDSLFKNLRNRWFIKVDDELFGYDNLKFDVKNIINKEPIEVKDFIVNKEIRKTRDMDKWYHPAYEPKDEKGNILYGSRAELEIARQAAKEKLVPLYGVSKASLLTSVLREIAKERLEELKAEVKDDKKNIKEILGHLDPDVENKSENEIDSLWKELQANWIKDLSSFLINILNKEIPIILLHKNEIGRASSIFEEINKGGTPLSNFDLIVAKAARATQNKFNTSLVNLILDILNKDLNVSHIDSEPLGGKWRASLFTSIQENLPSKKFQSIYLNLLSIFFYEKAKGLPISKDLISRNKILSLEPNFIVEYTEKITLAIARAYAFLQLKCGHINESQISYDYMVLPIAYLFYEDHNVWNDINKLKKIEAWFWASLFSGAYKERQDDQFIKDLKALKAWLIEDNIKSEDLSHWIEGGKVLLKSLRDKIFEKEDYSDENTLLHKNPNTDYTSPTSVKNSILQYVLSRKPQDLLPNNLTSLSAYKGALENPELQVHHIIPLNSVTKIGQSTKELRKDKKHILNSPLNLTYISDKANAMIRDKNIDDYFKDLSTFDLGTHFIPNNIEKPSTNSEIEKILKRRLELIKISVINHINNLLNS